MTQSEAVFSQTLLPKALKATLRNNLGIDFQTFRAGCKPRYQKVWMDIAAGYFTLGITLLVLAWLAGHLALAWQAVVVIPGAMLLGFVLAYIQLFLHEAAHFNLSPSRKANDWLSDCLIGSWTGLAIQNYRAIHFEHHRALGIPSDTERTYFNALNIPFLIASLIGLQALKSLTDASGR